MKYVRTYLRSNAVKELPTRLACIFTCGLKNLVRRVTTGAILFLTNKRNYYLVFKFLKVYINYPIFKFNVKVIGNSPICISILCIVLKFSPMLQYIKMVFTKSKSEESSFQIYRLFDNSMKIKIFSPK